MPKRSLAFLSEDSCSSGDESVSDFFNNRARTTKLCKRSVFDIDGLAHKLQEMVKRTRILHDIISLRGHRTRDQTAEEIAQRGDELCRTILAKIHPQKTPVGYHGAIFFVGKHYQENNEHLHIVHDCNYSNSACKCAIMAGLPVKRRNKRPVFRQDTTYDFWYNKLLYIVLSTRGNCHFFFASLDGNRRIYNVSQADYVRYEQSKGRHPEGEDPGQCNSLPCEDSGDVINGESEFSVTPTLTTSSRDVRQRNSKPSRVPTNYETKQIFNFLRNHYITPPINCCLVDKWFTSDLINITPLNKNFMEAINTFHRYIWNKGPVEIYNLYKDTDIYFSCTSSKLYGYHKLPESVDILMSFLMFQFQEEKDVVIPFLDTLYKHLHRNNGKMNTIWFKGPPNCGKSWFMRSLESLCLSVGKTSILNRNNSFPFSSCINTNLIIMDELNYEPERYTDTLKLLFGGDPISVSVKYENDRLLLKTPIILASNGDCIPNVDFFMCRVQKYEWEECKLDIFSKNLHPWAFIKLWEKFGIIDDEYIE